MTLFDIPTLFLYLSVSSHFSNVCLFHTSLPFLQFLQHPYISFPLHSYTYSISISTPLIYSTHPLYQGNSSLNILKLLSYLHTSYTFRHLFSQHPYASYIFTPPTHPDTSSLNDPMSLDYISTPPTHPDTSSLNIPTPSTVFYSTTFLHLYISSLNVPTHLNLYRYLFSQHPHIFYSILHLQYTPLLSISPPLTLLPHLHIPTSCV